MKQFRKANTNTRALVHSRTAARTERDRAAAAARRREATSAARSIPVVARELKGFQPTITRTTGPLQTGDDLRPQTSAGVPRRGGIRGPVVQRPMRSICRGHIVHLPIS